MRVGIGYDSHRLIAGRNLILGGITIPAARGLLGHSDADVLTHAICDAILGAIGVGDLGRHFPDTDPRYKDISSLKLLAAVNELAKGKGYRLHNIDVTVIMEQPKLAGYIQSIRESLARVIGIDPDFINVKATTNEGMGFTGREEGIAALATVSVTEDAEQGKNNDG